MAGGTAKPKELANPAPDWLSERSWSDILTLTALDKYSDFAVDFPNHVAKFKNIFDSVDPHRYAAGSFDNGNNINTTGTQRRTGPPGSLAFARWAARSAGQVGRHHVKC